MSLKSIYFSSIGKDDEEIEKQPNCVDSKEDINEEKNINKNNGSDMELHSDENTENMDRSSNSLYFYVGNIPKVFKSADLRYFFSEFVENESFCCFHYRHRPEIIKEMSKKEDGFSIKEQTCCCIVNIKKIFAKDFLKKYHKRQWYDKEKSFVKQLCNIRPFKLSSNPSKEYLSKKELHSKRHDSDQQIYSEDMGDLIELNPPKNVMPQGNIGTPTEYFRKMVANCLLPSSVIKKLGLQFSKKAKKYSTVQMNYETGTSKESSKTKKLKTDTSSDSEKSKADKGVEDEDIDTEEWDRYEALHDDVDNQALVQKKGFLKRTLK